MHVELFILHQKKGVTILLAYLVNKTFEFLFVVSLGKKNSNELLFYSSFTCVCFLQEGGNISAFLNAVEIC